MNRSSFSSSSGPTSVITVQRAPSAPAPVAPADINEVLAQRTLGEAERVRETADTALKVREGINVLAKVLGNAGDMKDADLQDAITIQRDQILLLSKIVGVTSQIKTSLELHRQDWLGLTDYFVDNDALHHELIQLQTDASQMSGRCQLLSDRLRLGGGTHSKLRAQAANYLSWLGWGFGVLGLTVAAGAVVVATSGAALAAAGISGAGSVGVIAGSTLVPAAYTVGVGAGLVAISSELQSQDALQAARQHFENLAVRLSLLSVRLADLNGKLSACKRFMQAERNRGINPLQPVTQSVTESIDRCIAACDSILKHAEPQLLD